MKTAALWFALFSVALLSSCDQANRFRWRVLGPGGGGSMFHPTVSPHEPDTALIACDMTGAYITRDNGKSWREFNLRSTVGAFEFDPVSPNVIFAGSTGLFRSDDRGESWRLVFPNPNSGVQDHMVGDHADHWFSSGDNWPGNGAWIQGIRVDSQDPNRIVVVVSQWGPLKVFYSADRGATWKQSAQLPSQTYLNMYLEPGAARATLFTDQGIYTVDPVSGATQSIPLPPGTATIRDAGAGRSGDAAVFYITAGPSGGSGDIWKSADGGRSWQNVHSNLAQGSFRSIAVASRNPDVVYLSAESYPDSSAYGILKTTDGGASWNWVLQATGWKYGGNYQIGWLDRNFPGWAGSAFALGADATGRICYGTDSGTAYRTADGGQTWEGVYSNEQPDLSSSSRGLDVTTSYGVHFDPFDRNHLVISYTDIGMFHSTNGGESWSQTVKGAPREWRNTSYWVAFDPEVKNRAWSVWSGAHDLPRPKMFKTSLAKYYVGGVCKTDDPGMNWGQCSQDLGATTHIIVDPKSPAGNRTLYATTFGNAGLSNSPAKPGGVYKSTDDGRTWTLASNGLGANRNGWHITMLPDGTLYLLIARGLNGIDGGIYRSTNGAANWQAVPVPSGANAPNDLVFDPANPSRMYLGCWPRTINSAERYGGLYVTEDGGASWRKAFEESAHVYGVALDPDNPSTVYINTFDGAAYRSDDRGESWQKLQGYNFKWGHRPIPDPHNKGMLYLTTFGSSVWWGPATGIPGDFEDLYPF